MKRIRKPVFWFFCLITMFFLISCGLPGELKKQAKDKSSQIEKAQVEVKAQKTKYLKLKESENFNFLKIYADREDWESIFQEAQDDLKRATDEIVNNKVAFLLKENKKEKATLLRIELARIDRIIKSSILKSKKPALRMAELERTKKEAPQRVKTAQKEMDDINNVIMPLETGIIPQAQKDFPERADEITKRFTPLKKLQRDAEKGLIMSQTQLELH